MIPLAKPLIGDEEIEAVTRVMRSGMIAQGPEVAALETEIAAYVKAKHAVACSSGTAALFLALKAYGIGEGDEVITSPFSFVATASSIMMCGARPVFADVGDDFNLHHVQRTLETAKPPMGKTRVKAILPVHLFGLPSNVANSEWLGEHHIPLPVIGDGAQAIGATYGGTSVFAMGAASCLSLYATKNICCGEGGVVFTNNAMIADRVRRLRQHCYSDTPYLHSGLGYNLRMTDIAAAIARVQLRHVEEWTAQRTANAEVLRGFLEREEKEEKVILPRPAPQGVCHAWHQFTVRVRNRDKVVAYLKEHGIGCGIFYPVPLHKQPFIRDIIGEVSLPNAERFADEVLQVPVGPHVNEHDMEQVAHALSAAVRTYC